MYYLEIFAYSFTLVAGKILRKIVEKLCTDFSENSYFSTEMRQRLKTHTAFFLSTADLVANVCSFVLRQVKFAREKAKKMESERSRATRFEVVYIVDGKECMK